MWCKPPGVAGSGAASPSPHEAYDLACIEVGWCWCGLPSPRSRHHRPKRSRVFLQKLSKVCYVGDVFLYTRGATPVFYNTLKVCAVCTASDIVPYTSVRSVHPLDSSRGYRYAVVKYKGILASSVRLRFRTLHFCRFCRTLTLHFCKVCTNARRVPEGTDTPLVVKTAPPR